VNAPSAFDSVPIGEPTAPLEPAPAGSPRRGLPAMLRALRPKQWLKNLLVFAAPVAAGVIDEPDKLLESVLAFVAFCLLASGTYLLNDARDIEADRLHPTKRHRPIAAGLLPLPLAFTLAAVFIVGALLIGFLVRPALGATLVAYLALTLAYSWKLKHIATADVVAVAAGFVLRAVAGAAATNVPISEWFFIVTSFGALLMISGKREGESRDLGDLAGTIRPTLSAYSPEFLSYLRSVSSSVVLVAYCLWAFNSSDTAGVNDVWFKVSILPFSVCILRYALLVSQGRGAEPEDLILSDGVLVASGVVWALVYGVAIYAR
jgi:decaprenyl-phosphate phosphoribosyltransferase